MALETIGSLCCLEIMKVSYISWQTSNKCIVHDHFDMCGLNFIYRQLYNLALKRLFSSANGFASSTSTLSSVVFPGAPGVALFFGAA